MKRIKGGNWVYKLCTLWSDIWFFLIGIRVEKINTQYYDKTKKYIIVPNHISYLDIPVLVNVFRTPIRPLGKHEMTRIPVFGFLYSRAIVSVDRKNSENRAESIRILKSVIQKGISVLVFPEGTFNTTHQPLKEFYNGAFRIAIETQTPIKPVLFLDTFDRMHYDSVLSLNPGKCRVVYLPDIDVTGLNLDNLENLKQKTYNIMEQALQQHRARWIESSKNNIS
ncbi:MAG: lysophospholipid acyltransferase family protein [Niabella sp.]